MNIAQLIDRVPEGTTTGEFRGARWNITRTSHNDGRSCKIYAEELGGNDFISLNFYRTENADLLKPCEMPEQKVVEFLSEVELEFSE